MSIPQMSPYRNMAHLQKHFYRLMVAAKSVLEIHTNAPIVKNDPNNPYESNRKLVVEVHNRYERLKECIKNIEAMEENP